MFPIIVCGGRLVGDTVTLIACCKPNQVVIWTSTGNISLDTSSGYVITGTLTGKGAWKVNADCCPT